MLGPLVARQNGSELGITGPKRRALLTFLALHLGEPVSVERIVEALWPSGLTGREESTLRVHVSHLRDELEPDRNGKPRILLTEGSAYLLSSEEVELDLIEFEDLARAGRSTLDAEPTVALEKLNRALELWRGRALQDVEYEEFAQESIRRLDKLRTEAIEDRAAALIQIGEDSSAIEDLESLVGADPTRERAVSLLMRAHYRLGRQTESLRVARRHRRHLAELGLEPSPSFGGLEDRILQHDPTLLPEGQTSVADIKAGRSIRGYELREEAGSGSIGLVFRAFQASVGREVAVKVIDPGLAESPDFVRRFAEEARVIASLEHPHIVPLHDFWREPGGAFLIMRWMEGGNLGERLGEVWSADRVGRVFGQLTEALGYAHEAGVIHRDVKPANVLFDGAGNAYLCDFGLAVATEADHGEEPNRRRTVEPPYASPEILRGERPGVATDIYSLGVMLGQVAAAEGFANDETKLEGLLREVVLVATADNPGDRFPDMAAFGLALRDALGTTHMPAPRRVRRNPYKGLEPFDETDQAVFYGRDDVIEALLDSVRARGLTAVVGASGSGKSSVVMAGLVPELRREALPGSDEWFIVRMVPGTDPFEEFRQSLLGTAMGRLSATEGDRARELRYAFAQALDGPRSQAVLIVDQFEELFSSVVDPATRKQFIDNLIDLAADHTHRVRVVVTVRADFADRPLAQPLLGDLMSRGSILLAPMRPEQVEEVIRAPATRVGVQVEPGLVAEVIRDVSSSPAYLPLLQYVLSELFEMRTEDRLTVSAYRSLGGVQGVLERRAEETFASLSAGAREASRQLFLRMVHLGEGGEETRRRLPLIELHGLGGRAEADEALSAFSRARLLTYDRDPVTRAPTVEVAHETVIRHWARYRIWIDEARADLLAHRRVSAAARTWEQSGEDPSYLLTGGPLVAALEVAEGDRVDFNEFETRYVSESHRVEEERKRSEEERTRQQAAVEQRSRRRLLVGVGAGLLAIAVGVLAVFAFLQRQRADDLAAEQERQNAAREWAAASVANLDSADPDLSLLLAIEAADQSIDAGEEVLPEVVDALHLAVINPRPDLIIEGAGSGLGGEIISFSTGGFEMAMIRDDGTVAVVDPASGEFLAEIPATAQPAIGVDFHLDGSRVLTVHRDGVRVWDWQSGTLDLEVLPDVEVTAAKLSGDGSMIAIAGADGVIRVVRTGSGELVSELIGHEGRVNSIDFDPRGQRLVSGGADNRTIVWDVRSGEVVSTANTPTIILPVSHLAWNSSPFFPYAVVTTSQNETFLFDTRTGDRVNSFGNGQNRNNAVAFSGDGSLMVAAGGDGVARLYGALTGGEVAIELPTGGVPLRDAEFLPGTYGVATVGVDGTIRIWRDISRSEMTARWTPSLYPSMRASDDGSRYAINANALHLEFPGDYPSTIEVIDADTGDVTLTRDTWRGWYTLGAPAVNGDGSRVAFAGPSGDIEVVEVDTGSTISIPESAGWTNALDFNADGSLLAGASLHGDIGVWSSSTGEPVAVLEGH
ncbi:MAG: BTAD domain-containing putative transcriptional regulator, partial [Acidimicrobiia bacterium]